MPIAMPNKKGKPATAATSPHERINADTGSDLRHAVRKNGVSRGHGRQVLRIGQGVLLGALECGDGVGSRCDRLEQVDQSRNRNRRHAERCCRSNNAGLCKRFGLTT